MKNTLWYEIVIEDYSLLSGLSVSNLVEHVNVTEKCHYAYCDALDGGNIQWFLNNQHTLLRYEEIKNNLKDNVIFEWGDFFLFKDKPIKFQYEKTIKYFEVISQTDCTLRLVDGNYIYIYTKKFDTLSSLEKIYKIATITSGNADSLTFPE